MLKNEVNIFYNLSYEPNVLGYVTTVIIHVDFMRQNVQNTCLHV